MDQASIKITVGSNSLKLFLSAELRVHLLLFHVDRRKVNTASHQDHVAAKTCAAGQSDRLLRQLYIFGSFLGYCPDYFEFFDMVSKFMVAVDVLYVPIVVLVSI